MPGNSFGKMFQITTWGESHGPAIGGVVDGCPAGIPISEKEIQKELNRRRPGQSKITTSRKEADEVKILSGVFEGKTTGTPISLIIYNQDQQPKDYLKLKNYYRPGHADETYDLKYGLRDHRGGGRASARETAIRVAAGSIAKKILPKNLLVKAYTRQIQDLVIENPDLSVIEKNSVRAADMKIARQMEALILETKKKNDSLGGVIEIQIHHCPIGLGEPVFDKLKADLAKSLLSINGAMGFEYGPGFLVAKLHGSECNQTEAGMYGGISNGKPMTLRVAFKPTSSINIEGRHDPCLLPRAIPICEAMVYLVLADHWLRQKTQNS